MSLFESVVFREKVKIISSYNDGLVHFVGSDDTSEDSTTNTNVSSEGTFLVNVFSFNSFLRGFES